MKCCNNPDIREGCEAHVCISCGQIDSQVFCPFESYEVNRFEYRKKKSLHSRMRWFCNMVVKYVSDNMDRRIICDDFQQLVRCYEKHGLVEGRNMSVYGYYIRRLCESRGIPLTGGPRGEKYRDVKTPKIRKEFDRRYNIAIKILGWDRTIMI